MLLSGAAALLPLHLEGQELFMPEITSPAFCISAHAPPVPLMLKKYLSPVKICGIRFALFAKDAFNPSYSGRRRLFFLNTEPSQVCSIAYMRSSTYFSAPNFPLVVFHCIHFDYIRVFIPKVTFNATLLCFIFRHLRNMDNRF